MIERPSGVQIGDANVWPFSEREGISCCWVPSAFMSQILPPLSPNPSDLRNTICKPSGDTEPAQPSSVSCRGLPPSTEKVQRPSLSAVGDGEDPSNWVLSGNHVRN